MSRDYPTNTDDLIDSRDVIARIEELEAERAEIADLDSEGDQELLNNQQRLLEDWDNDNFHELNALKELAEEADGYSSDWQHGATLIADDYFETYAQDMVEEMGDMPRAYIEIDWNATARNLQLDYTAVDFDGVTYWVR